MISKYQLFACCGVKPTRAKAALAFAAAAVAASFTFSSVSAQGAPRHGGTAIVVIGADPAVTNPDISTGTTDGIVGCMVHEGLLRVERGFKMQPGLAESWNVSPNGLTYTFHLADARWQDGQLITAEDVKFTLEEISAKYGLTYQRAARFVKSIETPAPRTVVITLKQPFGPFLYTMTCEHNTAIMPAHILRGQDVLKSPASIGSPVGAGPFKIARWIQGNYIELDANKDYFRKGEPYLDRIIIRIMPDAGTRLLALQAGEVDYIDQYYFPASSIPLVEKDPRFQTNSMRDPSDDIMILNTKQPQLAKPEVRQALFQAIDRGYLLKNVFLNHGDVGRSAIDTRLAWAYNPAVDFEKLYPYDPEAAGKKLDEAGFPKKADGTRFTMRITFDTGRPEYNSLAQAIRSYWQAIGVNTVLEGAERPVVLQQVYNNYDFDATLQNYSTGGDPVFGIARAYTTDSIKKGTTFNNASGYSNPEIDQLFVAGQNAPTPEERSRPYFEVQEILAKDMPTYVLHQAALQGAATARLKNLWLAAGEQWWGSVWMDQ